MATYKVLQDIEAEDKLLGPLTLRQFVYGAVASVCLYLSYFLATHDAAFMMVLFIPAALATGFFAFPWGRDQPTELWALAKIRFALKPRKRIWDQSGVKELVTITAPKRVATNFSNNLSQEEVKSRLQALASTVDTRGWAVKNANINAFSAAQAPDASDRLAGPALLPKPVDDIGIQASDDILDEQNNAGAQRLKNMVDQSAKAHHDKLIKSLNQPAQARSAKPEPASYWFLNQPRTPAKVPNDAVTFNTQVVEPGAQDSGSTAAPVSAPDEAKIVADLERRKRQSPTGAYYGHMHTIQPLSAQPPPQPAAPPAVPAGQTAAPGGQTAYDPVTPQPQAAILHLANNDDLNVATIAREAERSAPGDEVVIKLR